MKNIFKTALTAMLIVMTVALVGTAIYFGSFADRAEAATANPSSASTGYEMHVVPISAISAATTGIVKIPMPWPHRVGCVYAVAQDVTGTITIDLVNAAGTSLLASAMTLSTVVSEATLTTATSNLSIADESWMALNTANTGTANNVTVNICTKRL